VKRRAEQLATERRSAAAGAAAWEERTALETSAIILKRGRMAVIEAEANIQRSPQEVFDDCSNHIHEPEWNIKMKAVEKLTDVPMGLGTRYRMAFTSAPFVISECVRFERPSVWEIVGRSRVMTFGWRGRVLPRGDGASPDAADGDPAPRASGVGGAATASPDATRAGARHRHHQGQARGARPECYNVTGSGS
jgi:hypothetical protein